MNKQDFIAKIVKDTGATKAAAGKMLDSTLETIGKTLKTELRKLLAGDAP